MSCPILSLAGIPAGTYTLTASYEGDSNNAPSASTPTTLYIGVQNNQVFLEASPVTVTPPGTVTLTARMINQNRDTYPTSGEVIFYANGTKIGSAPVNSGGTATVDRVH